MIYAEARDLIKNGDLIAIRSRHGGLARWIRLICSALSAAIYLHSGRARGGLPSIPSPRDVVDWLAAPPLVEIRNT